MNSNAPFSVDRDDRLAEVLDAYLAAQEAGTPPDVDEFLARYPELAGELRECLASLAFIRRAGNLSVAGDAPAEGEAGGVLGDFRILREVGRGGMGVVYEAEQISLRRRVALKVLPFAATMDPRHLQRFHNEAQAAACLHHTNIVPVYFVGSERSVHFYAMQFIDGQPLSDIIRQLGRLEKKTQSAGEEQTVAYQPSPSGDAASTPPLAAITPLTGEGRRSRDYFRKVAELGVQAAEALDHAHQLGIVHRDIKPANLLLDGRGNVWVTDFGLAHVQHGEASLTGTGQMVGTPRYMSPEQALAKRVPIDHRTDVYSLGATLYELLTLRPAFASENRQELMRHIAHEEPLRPRQLERAVPAELEIIVLKAMEKRPQDRYATAQELADDMQRWLLDQPIRARRPSLIRVAQKWMRRHQAAMWASSLLILVLTLIGFVNALWWMRQQTAAEMEAAKKRIAAVTEAEAALHEAKRWQRDERWMEALSAVRSAQAALRGFGSEGDLQHQADELGKDLEMAQRLEEARLQLTGARDHEAFDTDGWIAAYAAAFAWYGLDVEHGDAGAAAEFIRSRSIPKQLVVALDNWATLHRSKKNPEWKHVLAVARAVDADELRNQLRDAWERRDSKTLNDLLISAGADKLSPSMLDLLFFSCFELAKVSGERVATLLRQMQQRHPADFWINHLLAQFLLDAQPPQPEEVIRHFMIAVALRPQSPGARLNLGAALHDNGRVDEAIAEYREAIRLKNDYAEAHSNLGNALRKKGRVDEAIAEYQEAIRLNKDFAFAHSGLGNALRNKGRVDEAIAEHREAIRLQKDWATGHYNLGGSLMDKGQLDEAIAEFHEAIRIEKNNAKAHFNLGLGLMGKGQVDEAIAEYREAIRLKEDFAEPHCNLGQVLLKRGKFQEAVQELRRGHEIGSRQPGWRYPSARWVRNAESLADLNTRLPELLKGQERPKDARERLALAQLCQQHKQLFAAASGWYSEAFAEEPKLADDLNAQHRYNAACAAAVAGCGQGADANKLDANERDRLRRQALDWLRADLKAYRQLMEKSAGKAGPAIAQRMQHWLKDEDFAGMRGDETLAKLLDAERSAWRELWADVAELLAKVQGQKPVEKKPDAKSLPR